MGRIDNGSYRAELVKNHVAVAGGVGGESRSNTQAEHIQFVGQRALCQVQRNGIGVASKISVNLSLTVSPRIDAYTYSRRPVVGERVPGVLAS